jgi:ABC-2 type transport system permease protein
VGELAAIYVHLIGARVRGQVQYRLSFALFLVGQFLAAFMDLAAILVLFGRVDSLASWSIDDVLYLYGVSQVAFCAADMFASQVDRCALHIRQGTFDQLLVRPLGPLFQLSTGEFELRRGGKLLQALLVFAVAAVRLPVPWTPVRVVVTLLTMASGFVIFGSLWVITSSVSFWTIETQEISNSFTYGGGFMSQYPVDVFAGWLRRTLLVVPLAFVAYLPATWVLRKDDVYGFPTVIVLSSALAAAAVALLARVVWRAAIRHYRSTGS